MSEDDGLEGMDLTPAQARVLALHLVARNTREGGWLEWGDLPNLGEYAFNRLADAVDKVAAELDVQSKRLQAYEDEDAATLLEMAQ